MSIDPITGNFYVGPGDTPTDTTQGPTNSPTPSGQTSATDLNPYASQGSENNPSGNNPSYDPYGYLTPEDPNKIRAQHQDEMQRMIQGIRDSYAGEYKGLDQYRKESLARTGAFVNNRGSGGLGTSTENTLAAGVEQDVGDKRTAIDARVNAATQSAIFGYKKLEQDDLNAQRLLAAGKKEDYDKLTANNKTNAEGIVKNLAADGNYTIDTFKAANGGKMYQDLSKKLGSDLAVDELFNSNKPKAAQIDWKDVYRADANGNAILHRYGIDPVTKEVTSHDYNVGVPYSEIANGNAKTIDGHIYAQQADGSYKRLDPVSESEKADALYKSAQTNAANASAAKSYAEVSKIKDGNTVLSIADAKALGVPYGTTKDQAVALGKVPGVEQADASRAKDQVKLVKDSIASAKELAGHSGSNTWWEKTKEGLTGATPYTNLVAETNTIRTNVLTLMTDPAIKKFFGPQMSEADVRLMTAAGTTLNPELQSPQKLTAELTRLEALMTKLEKAANSVGGQSGNSDEAELKAAGYSDEQIKAIKAK